MGRVAKDGEELGVGEGQGLIAVFDEDVTFDSAGEDSGSVGRVARVNDGMWKGEVDCEAVAWGWEVRVLPEVVP